MQIGSAFAFEVNLDSLFKAKDHTLAGTPVQADHDIAGNLENSPQLSSLVEGLKAADLFETLKGAGPYTIFAPINAAFDKLPTDAFSELLKPEHKATLVKIMSYQIVEGLFDAQAMTKLMRDNRQGIAELTTLDGHKLSVSVSGGGHDLEVEDNKGSKARITAADLKVSNGVIHVTNLLMQP
jgi:uncharacterized surface protein with fasciclin (FAS1) repeats